MGNTNGSVGGEGKYLKQEKRLIKILQTRRGRGLSIHDVLRTEEKRIKKLESLSRGC